MNFDLTKEQEALRQRVRDFAEQEVKPVARENDEDQHFDVSLGHDRPKGIRWSRA